MSAAQQTRKRVLAILVVAMAFIGYGGFAYADVISETWEIRLDSNGDFMSGVGSGYNDGTGINGRPWYDYPADNWINQWFDDRPYMPDMIKYVALALTVVPIDVHQDATFDITINWTDPDFWNPNDPNYDPNAPPLPPLDQPYIVRATPLTFNWDAQANGGHGAWDSASFGPLLLAVTELYIPYCPEWVSVDIRGNNVYANGVLAHECLPVPEPATISLLGLGVLGLVARGYSGRSAKKSLRA